MWLNGAPGSGKGVNTPFILESRGLTRAVTMSSLFQDREEIRKVMDAGELVPDTMVRASLQYPLSDSAYPSPSDPLTPPVAHFLA